MTWHLKDRFLEEGLCERYPDFLTALNNAAELSVGCNFVAVEFNSQLSNGDIHENHLVFEPDELKEIYEYNPRSWNKYPEVEPPRNITMRLELFRSDSEFHHTYRYAAIFIAGNWWSNNNMIEINEGDEVRFRSWED